MWSGPLRCETTCPRRLGQQGHGIPQSLFFKAFFFFLTDNFEQTALLWFYVDIVSFYCPIYDVEFMTFNSFYQHFPKKKSGIKQRLSDFSNDECLYR